MTPSICHERHRYDVIDKLVIPGVPVSIVLRVAREKDFIGLTNKCFIFFSLFAIKKQQNNKVLWSFRMYICKQLDLFPLSRTSLHFH